MAMAALNHLIRIPGDAYSTSPLIGIGCVYGLALYDLKMRNSFLFQSMMTVNVTGGLVGTLSGCDTSLLEVIIKSRQP